VAVIVTGSSGFLGRHVAAALVAAGHKVLGLDASRPPDDAHWPHVTVDLTELGATMQLVRNASAVVHIAAIPRPTALAPETVFRTNLSSTYNVIEAAVLSGAERIVYASSMSVLGYPFFERPIRPAYLPIDSAHPVGPQDAYALSKWLGEEIVQSAVNRRPELCAVSLRMPWIQTAETFPREVSRRRAQARLVARDLWGYLDARDAASAFVSAVERPIVGHRRVYISAVDTFMDVETTTLVASAYPNMPFKQPLSAFDTVFDLGEARAVLGFQPRFAWRQYEREKKP
jgi:nucleoside-diphosphate-sugar epimerase